MVRLTSFCYTQIQNGNLWRKWIIVQNKAAKATVLCCQKLDFFFCFCWTTALNKVLFYRFLQKN